MGLRRAADKIVLEEPQQGRECSNTADLGRGGRQPRDFFLEDAGGDAKIAAKFRHARKDFGVESMGAARREMTLGVGGRSRAVRRSICSTRE